MIEHINIGGKQVEVRRKEYIKNQIVRRFNEVYSSQKRKDLEERNVAAIREIAEGQRKVAQESVNANILTPEEYKAALEKISADQLTNELAIKTSIPNTYFYWAAWKLIVKKGVWPFMKPFRSYRQMCKEIEMDETMEVVRFIGSKILKYPTVINESTQEKKTN